MYCPKCGTYNEDSYCFCLSCGTRIEEQSSASFDRKTSDGRYIIDPGEWSASSGVEHPAVSNPLQNEILVSSQASERAFEQAAESDVKDISRPIQSDKVPCQGDSVEDDVIVLRRAESKAFVANTRHVPSAAETPPALPRGFRIFLACCAVLVLWIILTAVIIPGLNLRKQGAIIQAVVMCGALAVIKASWKSIVGDKSKSDKKEG